MDDPQTAEPDPRAALIARLREALIYTTAICISEGATEAAEGGMEVLGMTRKQVLEAAYGD